MDLTPRSSQPSQLTFRQAQESRDQSIWQAMGQVPLEEAMKTWLAGLKGHTRTSYRISLQKLLDLGLVPGGLSLQEFSLLNHEAAIDQIKQVETWSEATRQARAAAYISFTAFLQRRTGGLVHKAVASREGVSRTFYKIREKVKTRPLNPEQTKAFLKELEQLNPRDGLIAKLMLQGGKRKSEVLALQSADIDFAHGVITYTQSKTRGMIKQTHITYPAHVLAELQNYLEGRQGLVFITRRGKALAPFQIDRNFLKAGQLAQIPFRVTPHVLRVTLVTRLKELQVQDSDIMKITGHASPSQLIAYDRSDPADNASARFSFV